MRRAIAAILTVFMLFGFTSCGYKLDDEKDALGIIRCSRNNIYGLELIAVFEEKVVFVFDKRPNDVSMIKDISDYITSYTGNPYLRVDGTVYRDAEIVINDKNDRCELTLLHGNYKEVDEESDKPFEYISLMMDEIDITYNDGKIELDRKEIGMDIIFHYNQTFDVSQKKWSAVREDSEGFDLNF